MTCAWALLYIERWLTAPMLQEDGTMVERNTGAPKGGVVSPIPVADALFEFAHLGGTHDILVGLDGRMTAFGQPQ